MEESIKHTPPDEQLKKSVCDKFDNHKSYVGSHIRNAIMQTDFKILRENPAQKPAKLKKGDVILTYEGVKRRPSVVTNITKDKTVVYIPLTSTENLHCLTKSSDRFWGEGCFSKTFSVCTYDYAMENFVGVYENKKLLNEARKALKEYIVKNL